MKEIITEYGAVAMAMLAVAGTVLTLKMQLFDAGSNLMNYVLTWLCGGI